MTKKLHHFLLIYSFADGRLVRQSTFDDSSTASTAYSAAERDYREKSDDFEIVLVGSDSIETVMRTHGHYFAESSDASPFSLPAA